MDSLFPYTITCTSRERLKHPLVIRGKMEVVQPALWSVCIGVFEICGGAIGGVLVDRNTGLL